MHRHTTTTPRSQAHASVLLLFLHPQLHHRKQRSSFCGAQCSIRTMSTPSLTKIPVTMVVSLVRATPPSQFSSSLTRSWLESIDLHPLSLRQPTCWLQVLVLSSPSLILDWIHNNRTLKSAPSTQAISVSYCNCCAGVRFHNSCQDDAKKSLVMLINAIICTATFRHRTQLWFSRAQRQCRLRRRCYAMSTQHCHPTTCGMHVLTISCPVSVREAFEDSSRHLPRCIILVVPFTTRFNPFQFSQRGCAMFLLTYFDAKQKVWSVNCKTTNLAAKALYRLASLASRSACLFDTDLVAFTQPGIRRAPTQR